MKETITSLLEPLLSGSRMTPEQFLWTSLVIGLILASIHLITMMVTKWGNRGITTKSLIFSIVVHLSLIFGLVAVETPAAIIPEGGREEEPETVIQLAPTSTEEETETVEQATPVEEEPVWDRMPEPEPVEVARVDIPLEEFAPIEQERTEPEATDQPQVDVESPQVLPDVPAMEPSPAAVADVTTPREAVETPTIEESTAQARPDLEAPSPQMTRAEPLFTELAPNEIVREPKRGSVERIDRKLDLASRTSSTDAPLDPASELKRGPELELDAHRTGPAPSSVPIPEPGVSNDIAATQEPSSSAVSSLLQRALPASTPSTSGTALERIRPDVLNDAGDPLERPIMVRDPGTLELARIGPTPDLNRPQFNAVRNRKEGGVPSTYRLRNLARRREIAREYGGTDESEKAVEASLKWLALHQHADGYWDADAHGAGTVEKDENGVDRKFAGRDADSGVTALAVLAFLAAGYTHEEGQYAEQVDRALKWLVRQQRSDGNLAYGAGHYAMMYCHAMATYAIAEAYAMQADPATDSRLREPIAKAVGFILSRQNPKDGGWRYVPGTDGDMSMFGWQLMALKSAELAGLQIPADSRSKMVRFLKEHSLGEQGGLAGYRSGSEPTPSMTAEALFCKQMLGIKRTNSASIQGAEYLAIRLPRKADWNEYYWYYGTLAMYQYGGKEWQAWNGALRDLLIAEQRTSGDHEGSWDPVGQWGAYGGRVYSTAMGALCLEVYYRFLPLYQMGGRYSEQ